VSPAEQGENVKKMLRTAGVSLSIVSAFALSACGAGGDDAGSSQPSTGTGLNVPDPRSTEGTQIGGGSATGGTTTPAVTPTTVAAVPVKPLVFEFMRTMAGRMEINTLEQLHVTFTGDKLRISYAPDAPVRSWLYIQPKQDGALSREFDLPIEAFPTFEGAGRYETTVRLSAQWADGSGASQVDVPLVMVVHDAPSLYNGTIAFSAREGELPAARVVSLDFGTIPDLAITATPDNGNSVAAQWMDVALDGSQLSVRPKAGVRPGHYEGFVKLSYAAFGSASAKRVPVVLDVVGTKAAIDYVTASSNRPGEPASVIVRGRGFMLNPVTQVKLGDVSASSFRVINDTQIVATFDTMPAAGTQALLIDTGAGAVTAAAALKTAAVPAAIAGNIDLKEPVYLARFDAYSGAIVVATAQHLYRLEQVDAAWKITASKAHNGESFAFSPDYKQLVVVHSTHLELLDATTLVSLRQLDLPNAETGGRGFQYVSLYEVMNNGDVLLGAEPAAPNGGVMAIYHLANQTFARLSQSLNFPMVRSTDMRDRLFLAANRDEGSPFTGVYHADTGVFEATALPAAGVYGNQFAYSGDGAFVLLNSRLYATNGGAAVDVSIPQAAGDLSLSPDGQSLYAVNVGAAKITVFVRSAGQWVTSRVITFPAYNYYAAGPSSIVTPDGKAMILYGGWFNASTTETRVVIIPLQ
jgi:hypothetical protein